MAAKTTGQIKSGTFPVRLKPEDGQSASVNWPLDGVARAATGSRLAQNGPDRKTAGRVIANFA